MTPDQLRAIIDFLQQRVQLKDAEPGADAAIAFDAPTIDDMTAAGLDAEGSGRILAAPWFGEMVEDIMDTPDMCEEGDTPEEVLAYARDVVTEYIRKRAEL
jgi:hypothetical protein